MKKICFLLFATAVAGLIQPRTVLAQPTLKTSKPTFAPNETIVVEYANPQGHVWDWVLVARPNDGDQSSFGADLGGKWSWQIGDQKSGTKNFGGLAEGRYEARYISWDGGNNRITARQPFTVGNAPPPPAPPVTPTPPPVSVTPAPPAGGPTKTVERTVNLDVPANQAWTPTGVILNPGDAVRIEASGSIEASKPSDPRVFYHNVPPEGRDEFIPHEPFPLLRGLCLVGKIGDGGHVLPVEKFVQILRGGEPYGTGELFLGINDDDVSDNAGVWKVRITIFTRVVTPPITTTATPTNTAPPIIEVFKKIPTAPGPTSAPPIATKPPAPTTTRPPTTGTVTPTVPPTAHTPPSNSPPASKTNYVWVCDGPTIVNGGGGTTWNPNFKASATQFTFTMDAGGKPSANTMTWTPPPLRLRAGDEVALTMTSTANPAPYLGGHWNVNCLLKASGENGASSNPGWRASSPHSGTMKFAFNPTAMSSGNPQIQVSAGNAGSDGGPSTYVLVTWVYKKQVDDGKLAPVSPPPTAPPLTTFTGVWDTTWGDMTLKQQGDHVTGTYTHPWHNGTIDGTVKDKALRFKWTQNNRPEGGTGRFTLSEDGKSFSGGYNNQKTNPEDASAGSWTGKRK